MTGASRSDGDADDDGDVDGPDYLAWQRQYNAAALAAAASAQVPEPASGLLLILTCLVPWRRFGTSQGLSRRK